LRSFDAVANVPPIPIPPGQKGARFFLGSGFSYVDYDDKAVRSIGYNIKKIPQFNVLHADVSHTFCSCEQGDFPVGKVGIEPTFFSPTVKLAITRNLNGEQIDRDQVEIDFHNTEIDMVSAIAIDNEVFVNFVANHPDIQGVAPLDWSIDDFVDSKISLVMDFFYLRHVSDFEEPSSARLHNFQIFTAGISKKCFALSSDILADQISQENPNLGIGGDVYCQQIVLEVPVNKQVFDLCLASISRGAD
jgi:hypothetical protein